MHDVHPALKVLTGHAIQHHRLFAIERHKRTTNAREARGCPILISNHLGGAIIGIAFLKPEEPSQVRG